MRTFCNPLNISYNYQKGFCGRESADPAVVIFKNEYYLFASHGEGYWVSSDLAEWEYIHVDIEKQPEFRLYAPAVCVIGDRLYLAHSQEGHVLYSENPRDPESWVDIGGPLPWGDPGFWYDEDGYVYVYESCIQLGKVTVSKLDPNNNMAVVEGPIVVCAHDLSNRGYERRGHNHELDDCTYFEGPWLNKYEGKYYLQCAVPGTEYDTYADSCFVSEHPMGPFTYCEYSPISFKSTGFVRGCGHGCLFQDLKGNWWKLQTNDISVNHIFERRISLYPAAFIDGKLYVNTIRADYPMLLPHENPAPFQNPCVGWALLSYNAQMDASSQLDAEHKPMYASNEHMGTWWSASSGNVGEWLSMDLGAVRRISALHINFADQNIPEETVGRKARYGYRYILESSEDGKEWSICLDRSQNTKDMPHDYVQLEREVSARFLKITNMGPVPGDGFFAISGLRVFGPAFGELVGNAPQFHVVRCEDARDMNVVIDPVDGAEGYYIRLGTEPDKLHIHYLIMSDTLCDKPIRIGCLNNGVTYYMTVDAYNSAGITLGTNIQMVK